MTAYTLVFGLTADPIHKGHKQVIINSFAYARMHGIEINKFLLVPTYQPNLIAGKQQPRTAYQHRYRMCELVTNEMIKYFNYPVEVSDIEKQLYLKSNKKSYSYDTLKAISDHNKLFVLSADHFAGRWPKFRKWHRWQTLVKENGLLIHQRPGHGINATFIQQLKTINPAIHLVKNLPAVDVSSTQIRQTINTNAKQNQLIDEAVYQYIKQYGMYQ